MNNCILNNDTYNVEVIFVNSFGSINEIQLDYISELRIENDSYDPFPRATLTVKDPNSTVIPMYAADNTSNVIITIQSLEMFGTETVEITKKHQYNINRVKPLNFDGVSNTYEISLTSVHIKNWAKYLNYSTGTNPIYSTKAIQNILAAADIPNIDPNLHSKYKTSYICDMNTPVSDHVNRLLDLSAIGGSGFYFPWYNMGTDTLEIESIMGMLNKERILSCNNIIISSDEGSGNDHTTARSVEYTNDITATQIDRISKGFIEVGLDYKTGKETEKTLTYQDIANGSAYTDLLPVIEHTTNLNVDINKAALSSNHNWFKNIRVAVRNYNGAVITILGTNQRNIGDTVLIDSAISLQHTFNGLWLIQRTIDLFKFGSRKYEQRLHVSRVSK